MIQTDETQLKNFRLSYPMYDDMDDGSLLTALRTKYPMYSDMDDLVFTGALEKKFGQVEQPRIMTRIQSLSLPPETPQKIPQQEPIAIGGHPVIPAEQVIRGAKAIGKGVGRFATSLPGVGGALMQELGERAEEEPLLLEGLALPGIAGEVFTTFKDIKSKIFRKTDLDEKIAKKGRNLYKKNQKWVARNFPKGDTKAERFLEDLGSGAGSLGMAVGITLLTKNPSLAAVTFGALAKGRMYAEAREKGKVPREAGKISTAAGVAEGALEKIGLDFLMKRFGGRIATHAIHMASEGSQEISQSLAGAAIATVGGISDDSIKDVLMTAGYEGLLGSLLGGGASVVLHRKADLEKLGVDPKVAEKLTNDIAEKSNKEAAKIAEFITPEELDKIGQELNEYDRNKYVKWWHDQFAETKRIRQLPRGKAEVLGRLETLEKEGLEKKPQVENIAGILRGEIERQRQLQMPVVGEQPIDVPPEFIDTIQRHINTRFMRGAVEKPKKLGPMVHRMPAEMPREPVKPTIHAESEFMNRVGDSEQFGFQIYRGTKIIGEGSYSISPDGIAKIGKVSSFKGEGSIGLTGIRSVQRNLISQNPNIKKFVGDRVSGAKIKAEEPIKPTVTRVPKEPPVEPKVPEKVSEGKVEKPIEVARKARAEKALGKPIKYDNKQFNTKREWLDHLKTKGYKPTKEDVKKPIKNIEKVRDELERLKRTAPIGNPNHPETIRLRELEESLKTERKDIEYRLVAPDETFVTVGRAEYDYFSGLPKPTPEAKAVPKETWEMTKEEYIQDNPDTGVGEKPHTWTVVWNNFNPDEKQLNGVFGEVRTIHGHTTKTFKTRDEALEFLHKSGVKKALSSGKPVPPEVLKDYPGLGKKSPTVKVEGAKHEQIVSPELLGQAKMPTGKIKPKVTKVKPFEGEEGVELAKKEGPKTEELFSGGPSARTVVAGTKKAITPALKVVEPAKLVEWRHGSKVSADVIKAFHHAQAQQIEFSDRAISKSDKTFGEVEQHLNKNFSNEELDNFMLTKGDPVDPEGIALQKEAISKISPEMSKIHKGTTTITQEASDIAYGKLLRFAEETSKGEGMTADEMAELNMFYVDDYFRGVYKNNDAYRDYIRDVKKAMQEHYRNSKSFMHPKVFKAYADAKAIYGLELKSPNPITNIKSEIGTIERIRANTWLRETLLKDGKDKYIMRQTLKEKRPQGWRAIGAEGDPVWNNMWAEPDLARLINNMLSINKITTNPVGRFFWSMNNYLRAFKFLGSAFHQMSVTKQDFADTGWFGFMNPKKFMGSVRDAIRITKKAHLKVLKDPTVKKAYRHYIRLGGTPVGQEGHFEIERAAVRQIEKLFDKTGAMKVFKTKPGKAILAVPKLPFRYVSWLFRWYIPQLKFQAYMKDIARREPKLGRNLTDAELIDTIKEGQNFYGEMNERLFGRSGTITTAMRFVWMAPGYAEGNYRTNIKALTQWEKGGPGDRSRQNVVNSLMISAVLATIGTLIFTKKPPKKPETVGNIRDLFKINTGLKDDRDRDIMVDMLTYDRDYWGIWGNLFTGQAEKIPSGVIDRIGGMTSGILGLATDVGELMQGKAVIDWKNDVVVDVPLDLQELMKFVTYEMSRAAPISTSTFAQSRRRGASAALAFTMSVAGVRTTVTEKEKRIRENWQKFYEMRNDREELFRYLATLKNPKGKVEGYNKQINKFVENDAIPEEIRGAGEKLLIKTESYLLRQYKIATGQYKATPAQKRRAEEILGNFDYKPVKPKATGAVRVTTPTVRKVTRATRVTKPRIAK